MPGQFQCPENLAIFKESCIFGAPFGSLWVPVVPKRDMMWCEILRPSFLLAHCTSFMSRWLDPWLLGQGHKLWHKQFLTQSTELSGHEFYANRWNCRQFCNYLTKILLWRYEYSKFSPFWSENVRQLYRFKKHTWAEIFSLVLWGRFSIWWVILCSKTDTFH